MLRKYDGDRLIVSRHVSIPLFIFFIIYSDFILSAIIMALENSTCIFFLGGSRS